LFSKKSNLYLTLNLTLPDCLSGVPSLWNRRGLDQDVLNDSIYSYKQKHSGKALSLFKERDFWREPERVR